MIQNTLEVKNLNRSFGVIKAVSDISFSVGEGEIVGLLGPNGAGKTTTINMILGVLTSDSGSVEVAGYNNKTHRSLAAGKMNFAAVYAHIPGNLTVKQSLNVFGRLYEVKELKNKIKTTLKEFDLEKFANSRIGWLSSGEQTRVNLAKAMINSPRLILLDEPTASLDPSVAGLIRERIRDYAKFNNASVLWTSHNMHEVEGVCDRVLFLSKGKIILEGNPKTLPQEYDKKNLEELFISIAREPLTLGFE